MDIYEYLTDRNFLKSLDTLTNKFFWVKIEVLNSADVPLKSIEGRVQPGSSISLNGSSSVRRTCTLNIIAEETENDLTDIDNLLSANKKIKIFEGFRNDINTVYDKIIWFPLGVYVIVQPNITHAVGGCNISLTCKDKMCLLNGECAGGLPTSITFHEYDQMIGLRDCGDKDPRTDTTLQPNDYTIYKGKVNKQVKYFSWTKVHGWKEESDASSVGDTISVPQRIYDIIQTLVYNYGGEDLAKIFINDVPLEIKQLVRYTGSGTLYCNTSTGMYTLDEEFVAENTNGAWRNFTYNDDVGYVYTDFTYPGSLVSGIGDNVCSVLDKIKNTLGNYEYFYDIEGNFVFQEIRNYLNNSYDPIDTYNLNNYGKKDVNTNENDVNIIAQNNYQMNIYSSNKSVYTFNEGNGLIISYANTPNYNNLKNDFHIWGENQDGYAIHYHLAIKNKPTIMNTYKVKFLQKNDEYTGGIRLASVVKWDASGKPIQWEDGAEDYQPNDWRAELYLQGLTKQSQQKRPDVYEQELLDLFDSIYNFYEPTYNSKGELLYRGKFKSNLVYHPNSLNYFFDYLEPINNLYDCSVDTLGTKIYSYKEDKINRLYNVDVPNYILIDLTMDDNSKKDMIKRCEREGQPYSNVNSVVYSNLSIGTSGYTAQETARNLLYQYTTYNESISLQSIPIYHLDVNTRITVEDRKSGIYGDYIINSISLPLDAGSTMTITASRALERI